MSMLLLIFRGRARKRFAPDTPCKAIAEKRQKYLFLESIVTIASVRSFDAKKRGLWRDFRPLPVNATDGRSKKSLYEDWIRKHRRSNYVYVHVQGVVNVHCKYNETIDFLNASLNNIAFGILVIQFRSHPVGSNRHRKYDAKNISLQFSRIKQTFSTKR